MERYSIARSTCVHSSVETRLDLSLRVFHGAGRHSMWKKPGTNKIVILSGARRPGTSKIVILSGAKDLGWAQVRFFPVGCRPVLCTATGDGALRSE